MTVELFADDSNKKMTKLIVNGKEINLKKCHDLSVTITINANVDNFITISTNGGTADSEIKKALR